MTEVLLLRRLNESYRRLGLRYSRMASALALMLLTALLEMGGLSVLYPLVLALGSDGRQLNAFSRYIPYGHDPAARLLVLLAAVGVIYVVKNVTLYFTYRHNINFAMYYYRNLVRGLYGAHISRSVLDFRQNSSGAFANVICTQTARLVDGVVRPLLVVVTESLMLLAVAAIVFVVSPRLILIVIVACGAAGAFYYARLRNKALDWGRRRAHAAGALHELVNNTAAGISEIKVFGRERYLTSMVYAAAVTETDMFRNLEMYQQGPRYLVESVFMVTVVAVYSIALLAGTDTTVLLAEFSVVAASSFRILPSINRIVGSYSTFSFHLGPALSLLEAIAGETLDFSAAAPNVLPSTTPLAAEVVACERVTFSYPGSPRPTLRDATLTIRKGQRIGIVGPTGSGKSTLVEILAGLYVPTSGRVLVDGEPIEPRLAAWHASIGYVPQVPFITPATIQENISFGSDTPVVEADVWAALERVGLAPFVRAQPAGLLTPIGEEGEGLSGGQKQLVCLARALYRRPTVLLLDEPTAALDGASERTVLDAIDNLERDKTVIMVSHKTHNFAGFDALYACDDGCLRPLRTPQMSGTAEYA